MLARRRCWKRSSRQGSRSPEEGGYPVCLAPTGRVTCARLDRYRKVNRGDKEFGEVAEWSKALDWNSSYIFTGVRGFESHPLRQMKSPAQVPGFFVVRGWGRTLQRRGRQNRRERFWTSLIASGAAISDGPAGAPATEGKAQSHPLRGLTSKDGYTSSALDLLLAILPATIPVHGYPQTSCFHHTRPDPARPRHGAAVVT